MPFGSLKQAMREQQPMKVQELHDSYKHLREMYKARDERCRFGHVCEQEATADLLRRSGMVVR